MDMQLEAEHQGSISGTSPSTIDGKDRVPGKTILGTAQSVLGRTKCVLQKLGFELQRNHRILELGCGSGRHVYEFRDAGYEAFGVDLGDYFQLRSPQDRSWFAVSSDPDIYRIPFADQSFDLVASTSTLEHVRLQDELFREIRRVLTVDGLSLHVFPSKWRPIEPHFKAPFGGGIRWEWYYLLCAALGFNGADYHAGQSVKEQAHMNWQYSRTALNYLSRKEIEYFASQSFRDVRFAEKEFVACTRSSSRVSKITHSLSRVFPPMITAYRGLHTKVVVLSGYAEQSTGVFGSWKLPSPVKSSGVVNRVGKTSPGRKK
jgi:SAM-dependent methyltransferase